VYKLEYLASAKTDILEIDIYLYENNPLAADKFVDNIDRMAETLIHHPYMYPIHEDDTYFRHIPLQYNVQHA